MKEEEGVSAIAQALPPSNLDNVTNTSLSHIPNKEFWTPNGSNHPSNPTNGGSQMITLSPPAGDPAGSQQEPGQGSSTAATGSDLTGDAEGVWSVDIDQAFQEALAIYPPCGRRKIIISDEGKMYGRNELIARYIKLRCGKTRTRKQVSSHIQVLARKKQRDEQAKKKATEAPTVTTLSNRTPLSVNASSVSAAPQVNSTAVSATIKQEPAVVPNQLPSRVPNMTQFPQIPQLPSNPSLGLADPDQLQILSKTSLLPAAAMYHHLWPFPTFQNTSSGFPPPDMKPVVSTAFPTSFAMVPAPVTCENPVTPLAIASSKLMLNGFTAYVESPTGDRVDIVNIPRHVGDLVKLSMSSISDKYPKLLNDLYEKGPKDAFFLAKCWANLQFTIGDNRHLFAVDSYYTSLNRFDISVSTKVCSFGSEVVEKVEIYSAEEEEDHFAFRLENSPMCEFMVKFIEELKKCENEEQMNVVLDNFTVLQVVTDKDTEETLMVLCFVFAVNTGPESQCSLFRLTS